MKEPHPGEVNNNCMQPSMNDHRLLSVSFIAYLKTLSARNGTLYPQLLSVPGNFRKPRGVIRIVYGNIERFPTYVQNAPFLEKLLSEGRVTRVQFRGHISAYEPF